MTAGFISACEAAGQSGVRVRDVARTSANKVTANCFGLGKGVTTLVIVTKHCFYLVKFIEDKRQVTQVLPNSNGLIERHILDNLAMSTPSGFVIKDSVGMELLQQTVRRRVS